MLIRSQEMSRYVEDGTLDVGIVRSRLGEGERQ
jgi:ATP phosphoribosyltransferase